MKPYQDPNSPGNSSEHHTGKKCIECKTRPAGTFWSPYWCFECNVKRMDEVERSLMGLQKRFENK